jgi:LuxR family transcriptional regulator, maltose regulon positive regulatory protein
MAQPSTPDRPGDEVAVADWDGLLATKLYVPRSRPELVSRTRLLERLAEGTMRELTLVCAPAGFGKTTLLSEWAKTSDRPVAWLSLDEGDNDPVRFWRHVAAALDRAGSLLGARLSAVLRHPDSVSFEAAPAALVNDLAHGKDQVILVLDDLHLVEAPAVHASLEYLLAHLPASLHLVLATRIDPPLPLARLRARGKLTEIREHDLRFTSVEAAELLRIAVGRRLSDAAVEALANRTEGWVTGLQLAALSLRGHADPTGFVASFSGSHRYVLDYLTQEVLDRQPRPLRAFLLETSVLERLSGPLCDAVTGRADSQQLLEQLEHSNLFLVPLDEVRGWWRYHQLFADLLHARLLQERPEQVSTLHRAAAGWFDEHGMPDDAIRHAVAAGEVLWAARLVERHVDARILRSQAVTLRRWLQGLPTELVSSRPRLSLAQAFLAAASDDVEAIQSALDNAERAVRDGNALDEPYEPSVGRANSLLVNVPAAIALQRATAAHLAGDPQQTSAFARRAQAELRKGEWTLESLTVFYLAVADWLRGELQAAEHAFASRVGVWLRAGQHTLAAWAYHYLGQVQIGQGRLAAALDTYQRALQEARTPDAPTLQITSLAHVGTAGVLYERSELESAHQHAAGGIRLCRQFAYTAPLATGLGVLARTLQAQGDQAGAAAAIREAELVEPRSAVGLLNPTPALRARLALTQGHLAEATRWVKERGLEVEDELSYPRETDHLVLARVLLANQEPDRALVLLGRLHADAATQSRTGSLIELRALEALALDAIGERRSGLNALAEALTLAAPPGYVRVFVDEAAPMATLVRELLMGRRLARSEAMTAPTAYLARLVEAFEQAGLSIRPSGKRGSVVMPGMVEPLTARELEVLGLLAVGESNQAIAKQLVVTVDTVKSHITRILTKLGASNRTQAVNRARELGLLR